MPKVCDFPKCGRGKSRCLCVDAPDAIAGVVREYVDRARGDRPDNLTPYEVRAFAAMDAILAALAEARKDGTCDWKLDESPDDDIWYSGCGQEWLFNAGGPEENGCKFCHHCGKPVTIIPRTPQPETPE